MDLLTDRSKGKEKLSLECLFLKFSLLPIPPSSLFISCPHQIFNVIVFQYSLERRREVKEMESEIDFKIHPFSIQS